MLQNEYLVANIGVEYASCLPPIGSDKQPCQRSIEPLVCLAKAVDLIERHFGIIGFVGAIGAVGKLCCADVTVLVVGVVREVHRGESNCHCLCHGNKSDCG